MSQNKQRVLDSHVHLWPRETANHSCHAWMPPSLIGKAREPAQYLDIVQGAGNNDSAFEVQGLVFVETDVRYGTPNGDISAWTRGPLDEISYLRGIVEGQQGEKVSDKIKGIVPWAPMTSSPSILEEYLQLARARAGEETWKRVKGFRFLLQSIRDPKTFIAVVQSDDFITNLKTLGRQGFSFDVGVDQRSGGIWQLNSMAVAMKMAHMDVEDEAKVTFVVNHMCKPNFSPSDTEFRDWELAMCLMSTTARTYIKLSGAFSELSQQQLALTPSALAKQLRPWLRHLFGTFGESRILFGSDWPVCNLPRPYAKDSWVSWKHVVASVLDDDEYLLSDEDKDQIWYKNAEEAYRLR